MIQGRTTGVVLDSGDGVTHAVPVYEGFAMPHGIRRVDLAGRDVTANLRLQLRKTIGLDLATSAETEVVRIMKEKCCYVALNPSKEEKEASGRYDEFTLPDGNVVKLGAERFRAPEILFNPDLVGMEHPGIHQVVVDAINKADMDLRKSLFSNIVLSGGTTHLRGILSVYCIIAIHDWYTGFGDRLLNEVKKLALKDIKIKISAPPERKVGSIISAYFLLNSRHI
jgi:centractin